MDTSEYFLALADVNGIPCQRLIKFVPSRVCFNEQEIHCEWAVEEGFEVESEPDKPAQ